MRHYLTILLLVLVGCGDHSASSAKPAERSLQDRLNELGQAKSVAVSVGDLDQDGSSEIVLSARNGSPAGPGLQTLGAEPSSGSGSDSVVLTHDKDGNLMVAPSNQGYDFSFALLLSTFTQSALSGEFAKLLKTLAVNEAACEIANAFGDWLAKVVKSGLVEPGVVKQLFDAMLGMIPNRSQPDPPPRYDEDFANCLHTSQTVPGCLFIQARYRLQSSAPGESCGFFNRCDHCYTSPRTPSGAHCPADLPSTLCSAREHASGCCNRDFVFDKVFRSDVRNMAPEAIDPATGPIAESMPVILDGSFFSLFPELHAALLLADIKSAVAVCFFNGISVTRNPIRLSVDTASADGKQRCARNQTQDGHVLEGWVRQCVSEDDAGVYSTIVGGGENTRFSMMNEAVGPYLLDKVRAHFTERVESALNEIESKGMCCDGAQVRGGTVEINSKGGLDIVASADAAEACHSPDPSGDDSDATKPGDSGASDGGSGGEGGATDANDPGGPDGSSDMGGVGGIGSGEAGDASACTSGCSNQQVEADDKKDPHLRTLDGLAYDFQASGEFLLFELTDDPQGTRAEIRQQPLSSDLCPQVTLNTAVAVRVNASRVAIYAQDPTPLRIAGVPSTLPPGQGLDLGAGSSLAALNPNTWEVRWPDGARLRIERDSWRGEYHLDVSLFAPLTWRRRTRGLLGDFDGNSANDFRTRQGTLLAMPLTWANLYDVFGASYQIRADESLFEPAGEAPFLKFTPPNTPALASTLPPELLNGVEQLCDATGVTDVTLRQACILDVACSGGDPAQANWIRDQSPPSTVAQITYDARFSAEHCRTLTPDGYTRVEGVSIPTDGSSVVTSTALDFGSVYQLRAWGTFHSATSGDGLGDAEYMNFSNPPSSVIDSCNGVDIGIAINAPAPAAKSTHWGTECASHSYTLDIVGQGVPLDLSYHECKLDDNQGTLQVDLFAPEKTCPGGTVGAPVAIVNGGFETPNAGNVSAYKTLQAGSSELQGWSIDSGELDLIQGGYWAHAEGTQSLDLNGIAAGTISQPLATIAGETYEVSFAMAANSSCAPTIKVLEVEADGQRASFQFDSSGHSNGNMGWQSMRFAFRATGSSTRLTFRSLVGGSCGPALDNVQIARLTCP